MKIKSILAGLFATLIVFAMLSSECGAFSLVGFDSSDRALSDETKQLIETGKKRVEATLNFLEEHYYYYGAWYNTILNETAWDTLSSRTSDVLDTRTWWGGTSSGTSLTAIRGGNRETIEILERLQERLLNKAMTKDPYKPIDRATLEDYLRRNKHPRDYEEDVYDCSDMSIYVARFFEENGYDSWFAFSLSEQHAWVLVDRPGYNDEHWIIETTADPLHRLGVIVDPFNSEYSKYTEAFSVVEWHEVPEIFK